jgi:hypothetical protein
MANVSLIDDLQAAASLNQNTAMAMMQDALAVQMGKFLDQ